MIIINNAPCLKQIYDNGCSENKMKTYNSAQNVEAIGKTKKSLNYFLQIFFTLTRIMIRLTNVANEVTPKGLDKID